MTPIQSKEDILPFADRIVAYTTQSRYFSTGSGFTFESDPALHFGYISAKPISMYLETGYDMSMLIKEKSAPSITYLRDSQVKNHPLSMRWATTGETRAIAKAIADNQAEFAYIPDKEAVRAILERHLQFSETASRSFTYARL